MPLSDELCFVQFMHPGGEHGLDRDAFKGLEHWTGLKLPPGKCGFKDWNRGPHRRKFVEIEGRCIRKNEDVTAPLQFWTEWEPQSNVKRIENPVPDGPKFIHKPFYSIPNSYCGLQNTDPFVFGDFLYTACQQQTKRGPTQLRHLKRGSVILFGSHRAGAFVLDTVFVVGQVVGAHSAASSHTLLTAVSRLYRDVTVAALYQDNLHCENLCAVSCGGPERSFRLYRGATINNRVNDMFSFFPCMPLIPPNKERGFARPPIAIDRIINPRLTQRFRPNAGLDESQVKAYWENVCRQVEGRGLWLGVSAHEPDGWFDTANNTLRNRIAPMATC